MVANGDGTQGGRLPRAWEVSGWSAIVVAVWVFGLAHPELAIDGSSAQRHMTIVEQHADAREAQALAEAQQRTVAALVSKLNRSRRQREDLRRQIERTVDADERARFVVDLRVVELRIERLEHSLASLADPYFPRKKRKPTAYRTAQIDPAALEPLLSL